MYSTLRFVYGTKVRYEDSVPVIKDSRSRLIRGGKGRLGRPVSRRQPAPDQGSRCAHLHRIISHNNKRGIILQLCNNAKRITFQRRPGAMEQLSYCQPASPLLLHSHNRCRRTAVFSAPVVGDARPYSGPPT
jgi:hypothetical protein